jgi:hypothetical protein
VTPGRRPVRRVPGRTPRGERLPRRSGGVGWSGREQSWRAASATSPSERAAWGGHHRHGAMLGCQAPSGASPSPTRHARPARANLTRPQQHRRARSRGRSQARRVGGERRFGVPRGDHHRPARRGRVRQDHAGAGGVRRPAGEGGGWGRIYWMTIGRDVRGKQPCWAKANDVIKLVAGARSCQVCRAPTGGRRGRGQGLVRMTSCWVALVMAT